MGNERPPVEGDGPSGKRLKAAALFAAAYGFPPSACRDEDEMLGLFQNIRTAMAIKAATFARGVAACLSAEANAELMKDCGAPAQDIARMRVEALKQKAGRR